MCRSIPLAILWSTLARPRRPNVISNVHSTGRLRRLRKLLTPLLLGAGIVAGMIAVPGTALAIPSGGWCYADYYEFGTLNGEVFKPYGNVRQLTNLTGEPVTWTESITVTTTFTSTYTTTTTFNGGLNLGIISFGVSDATQRTITNTITVSTTSTASTVVNAGQTKYMAYGSFGLDTTGTYYQERSGCDYGDYWTVRSGTINGYSLTTVGWRVWS